MPVVAGQRRGMGELAFVTCRRPAGPKTDHPFAPGGKLQSTHEALPFKVVPRNRLDVAADDPCERVKGKPFEHVRPADTTLARPAVPEREHSGEADTQVGTAIHHRGEDRAAVGQESEIALGRHTARE